jgi:heterodisulfide reductase subunit A-like polyferredoxin
VVVCSTCGSEVAAVGGFWFGRAIDLPDLLRRAAQSPGVVFAETLDFACFPTGLDHIQSRLEEAHLNRVVIGACSNRTHEALFQRLLWQSGLNPYLLELVNLREQCTAVHTQQRALANRKAQELIRIAVGRVVAAQPVHKAQSLCQPAALIIGGGVTGLTAALAIADSGYDVQLVERSEMLGGNLNNLYYVAEGYDPQRLLRDLVNRVRAHRRIVVHTRTEVVRHSGHVGNFRAELRTTYADGAADEFTVEHGATIVATGGRETREHPWLNLPHVITQRDLEEKIIHHPQEIAALDDVVMIQCVRPAGMPDYCSRVCCTNTLKNAIRLKLFKPACRVSVLYKNIVTYGFREEFYTEARRLGVMFIRYTDDEPPAIEVEADRLVVRVRDLSLNRELALPADLVPLSMTIAPAAGSVDLAKTLRVPITGEGFFKEAQLKLRPMDFMREGIFLAGMAHYPKFIEESISHALAAAARALTLLSQGALHLGGVVAWVDPKKCVGCLTCTRVCPFSIPQVIQQAGRSGVGGLGGAAYIDPAQCQGCGTCTGECPANAIQLINYTDEQMMLKAIGGLGRWAV